MENWVTRFIDWRLHVRRDMRTQGEVYRLLAACYASQRNPAFTLELLSRENIGYHRYQLRMMAARLGEGLGISDAMREAPTLFPEPTRQQITILENYDALPHFLSAWIDRDELANAMPASTVTRRGCLRPIAVALSMLFVLTFVFLFVVPTFAQMFDEFGLSLPAPTLLIMEAARWFAGYWFVPAFLAFNGVGVYLVLRSNEWLNRTVYDRFFPVRLRRLRSMRLRTLASLVARCGAETASEAVATTGQFVDSPNHDSWQGVEQAGWITHQERCLLSLSQSGEEAVWLLNRLADFLDYRNTRRQAVVGQIIKLLGTLCFGLLVGFICISLYMPLIELILGLT